MWQIKSVVMNYKKYRRIRQEREFLLHNRPPAKDITDIQLEDKIYKADFEIAEKYSSYSSEIIRLTLLGIAGYGFIISDILMKLKEIASKATGISVETYNLPLHVIALAAVGIFAFGVSLGLSLYHRFKITSCLYDQILISRSLLRLKNSHWTEAEKEHEKKVLEKVREYQKIEAKRYENILGWASKSLFTGFASVILLFFLVVINAFY
jgi:hypothetical protein